MLGGILSEKILYLDKLSVEYAESDSETAKNEVFRKYKEAVQELQNYKQLFSDVEELLNKYSNNVVLKFREQFPQIRGEKLDMVIMFFTRMPYKTIELFFRYHNVESLKQVRTRIRRTIAASGVKDAPLFLEMLEMKKGGRKPKQDEVS